MKASNHSSYWNSVTRNRLGIVVFVAAMLLMQTSALAQPKLFFSASDVATIRDRITREPFVSMWNTVKSLADAHPNDAYDPYNNSINGRNNAFAYLITGNTVYSDRAKEYCLEMINDSSYWAVDSSKGLTRAFMGLGAAEIYDFCKDSWDTSTKTLVSTKLRDMGDSLMRSGGSGWPSDPASNWRAVVRGGAGMCLLASDTASTSYTPVSAYNEVLLYFNSSLTTNPNSKGWGVAPLNYVNYPANIYGQFAVAMRRYDSTKDLMQANAGAKYAEWTTFIATTPIQRMPGHLGWYPDLGDGGNWRGDTDGNASFYFANSPAEYRAGIKWQYDRLYGAQGDQTWDQNWGGAIYSILDYPEDVVAKNPEQVWGRTYHDPVEGVSMFRNKYNDSNDFVALYKAKGVKPWQEHAGPDGNSIRILGLNTQWVNGALGGDARGQTTTFPNDPSVTYTSITRHACAEVASLARAWGDGYEIGEGTPITTGGANQSDTYVTNPRRTFITDYSRLSGAEAVFVIADTSADGKWWRLNSPDINSMALTSNGFVITSQDGHKMYGTVLWGDTSTLRKGTIGHGASEYEGNLYYNNNWVDLYSADANFVVVLTVMKDGAACPTITHTGTGVNQTITIGDEVITLNGTNIAVKSWSMQATNIGDANYDNEVNVIDLGLLATNYGLTGNQWIDGDFNGDGLVDVIDLGLMATHYGQTYTGYTGVIPEPATLALLAMGGIGITRRKSL